MEEVAAPLTSAPRKRNTIITLYVVVEPTLRLITRLKVRFRFTVVIFDFGFLFLYPTRVITLDDHQ
jgi:hypothetical protein